MALATPPPGLLSTDRTEGSTPFAVIGVDLQGPSSTVSEERPILHCAHAVLNKDYSWKYYQTWRPVNS